MDNPILQKKNRQNINRINSIINQYETKLDTRVNQVIQEMINYTKKITDSSLLPIVRDKKTQSQKHVQKQAAYKHRNKSSSMHSQLSFLTDNSLQTEIGQLKHTFKQTDSNKIIYQSGRPIGNRLFIRPKFSKKKPDIVPRQVRLNPLHQRNAIKAYQLDLGLLSLIQKGKIGKDVNIITAFQKGRPILQTQKAIFHQGQQRFAELQLQKSGISEGIKDERLKMQKQMNLKDSSYEESWALTMPKDGDYALKHNSNSLADGSRQYKLKFLATSFRQQLYIKISHYKINQDLNFRLVVNNNLIYKSEIIQLLGDLGKLMKIYSIQLGYVDSSKILDYACSTKKLTKNQLLSCIVGFNKDNNLISLAKIKGIRQKYTLSLDKVISSLKFMVQRKHFRKYIEKKIIANKIYGWAVSCWTVRKHKQLILQNRKKIQEDYLNLQKQFKKKIETIQQQKHYQIHIANQMISGKESYKQILNIQITKIFNIKNINKFIIYILPSALDEQTINYYYKIMELEQIPNYKERVAFLQVDPLHNFKDSFTLSEKLYYNSSTIRKLKKKIKDYPAYFVLSYPSLLNIKLACYLNIPIVSGNLHTTLYLEKRTSLQEFNVQTTDRYVVTTTQHTNLTTISDQIQEFCYNNKKNSKYVIKINNRNKSSGIALLTFPFSSLPEMYTNTTLITQENDVDQFYHTLLKEGGIIEKYEEGSDFVSVVIQLSITGQINIIGTFQKISSGFVNIGYIFPQKKVQHSWLISKSLTACQKLIQVGHFGIVELTFIVSDLQYIYLQKVQCYITHLGSALYYYTFLSDGSFSQSGDYMAKIIDTFDQDGKEEEVVTQQPRSFCYLPFLLHFGLSDRQVNSFFQLCRMGGVSFDLQNKYGATFILLGCLKSSMGLITTAKDKKGASKLMLKSLEFIIKQNSHNMSNETLAEKEVRMRERQNIINIKQRLEEV